MHSFSIISDSRPCGQIRYKLELARRTRTTTTATRAIESHCHRRPNQLEDFLTITCWNFKGGDGCLSVYLRFCKAFSRWWRRRRQLRILERSDTTFEKQSTNFLASGSCSLTERPHTLTNTHRGRRPAETSPSPTRGTPIILLSHGQPATDLARQVVIPSPISSWGPQARTIIQGSSHRSDSCANSLILP